MDFFTYMDRNPFSTCIIAFFICISLWGIATQFSEALQALFRSINMNRESEEKKEES